MHASNERGTYGDCVFTTASNGRARDEPTPKIFGFAAQLPARAKYVVVLTKADKRKGTGGADAAERAVRDAMRDAGVAAAVVDATAVVRTSSFTRKGRDEMWRQLRRVAMPPPPSTQDPNWAP